VLVTGATGGVGSIAVQLLSARGHEVWAMTGRVAEHEAWLKELGAAEVVDRADFSEPGKPLQKARLAGVVDTVGSTMLANASFPAHRGAAWPPRAAWPPATTCPRACCRSSCAGCSWWHQFRGRAQRCTRRGVEGAGRVPRHKRHPHRGSRSGWRGGSCASAVGRSGQRTHRRYAVATASLGTGPPEIWRYACAEASMVPGSVTIRPMPSSAAPTMLIRARSTTKPRMRR